MPNHVDCELIVIGTKAKVLQFKEFAEGKDMLIDCDKFIPYPKEYKEQDLKCCELNDKRATLVKVLEKEGKTRHEAWPIAAKEFPVGTDGFNSGGYEWCIENWGTKWGIYDCSLTSEHEYKGEVTIEYAFQCAWSPCFPVILAMGDKFRDMTFEFRYFECGAGFNGLYIVKHGTLGSDRQGEYFGHRGG